MTHLARLALLVYPPWFRVRYGQELAALVDQLPDSTTTTTDLYLGAARAWLRPPFRGGERRLRATMATTWVAWCAGFLVAPAVNRALLDPPTPAASTSVRALLTTGYVLFFLGWAFALIGAAPVVLRAVVPAVRAHTWTAVRPLLPAAVLGPAEALGVLLLALSHSGHNAPTLHPSGWFVAVGVLWLLGFVAFVGTLGIGPAVSLTRLEPGPRVLRNGTRLAMLLALTLAALTASSVAATVLAGDAALAGSAIPVAFALAVACVASLAALISCSRGLHALQQA